MSVEDEVAKLVGDILDVVEKGKELPVADFPHVCAEGAGKDKDTVSLTLNILW